MLSLLLLCQLSVRELQTWTGRIIRSNHLLLTCELIHNGSSEIAGKTVALPITTESKNRSHVNIQMTGDGVLLGRHKIQHFRFHYKINAAFALEVCCGQCSWI